jgi:hypothetical protein
MDIAEICEMAGVDLAVTEEEYEEIEYNGLYDPEELTICHVEYRLIESSAEIPYKKRSTIKEGCTIDSDPDPYCLDSWTEPEPALKKLKQYESKIRELSNHGMAYYQVTEFYVDESIVDDEGEFYDGGNIVEFSKMPKMEEE